MSHKSIFHFAALIFIAAIISCSGQDKDDMNTFEVVWKQVNETFFDSTFGGIDWRDTHDRYKLRISAAETDEEFYRIINLMLWELKVSHANIVPPGSIALYEPLVFAEGSPGIEIRMLNGKAVISSVIPESPADQAGLRPGYEIYAVDEIPVEQIVKEVDLHLSPPYNNRGRIAMITKVILGRIYGMPGQTVSIAYSDEAGKEWAKTIGREKRSGVLLGSNLFLATDFEAKRLDGGIGYIRVNTLQPQFAVRISGAIKSMGDIGGLIFDLRGNSGGEIEQMPELFLRERAFLYLRRSRSGEKKVYFDPAENAFKGPLVLLIDPLSGSASELFAAALQAIGRAVVVGERSPGAVLETDTMFLPEGAIFMYPTAQLVIPDGPVLEGYGVVPDIEIGLDRDSLLKGIDSQLESAVRYIKTKSQK